MKVIRLVATGVVASLALTSCTTTVSCAACQALPSSGTYHICSVDAQGAKHIQPGDKVLIGRIGNVTRAAYGPADDPKRTRLQLFRGEGGLVGWLPTGGVAHDDHVVVLGTLELPDDIGQCKKGAVLSIQFMQPDTDAKYRGASSGPHYGHGHGQIESLVPPDL